MPSWIVASVRFVDAVNYRVGRFAMYLFIPLGAILLYSTAWRVFAGQPVNWAIEMCQFILSAYYLLGGAYTMQVDGHVRMDLLYGRWSPMKRSTVDAITILFVIVYLAVLFAGGVSSTNYAIVYKQQNYSSWAPMLWPVKVVMTVGIFLVLLQAISNLVKDLAVVRGKPIA